MPRFSKQIMTADDNSWQSDGKKVKEVTWMGFLLSLNAAVTSPDSGVQRSCLKKNILLFFFIILLFFFTETP
jgi:hypothetical protein